MDVTAWLKELGLEAYADAFANNDIDAETLPELTAEDLREIGVASVGHRRRLLSAIAKQREAEEPHTYGSNEADEAEGFAGERRQVTVLFADLSGFTALSNELGAERTHRLLNAYFRTVDAVVERYGGSIDKHIGDSVMAVFGAPVAHDNDPERAVRAGCDIHEAMAELTHSLWRELGLEGERQLAAHVGIASGQVVASGTGSDSHREYTVTGESVNLASRLQDMASAGETLVSDELHRGLGGSLACTAVGETEVKGFAQPQKIWRLDAFLGGRRREQKIPFVGRQGEQRQFAGSVAQCLETGRGQSILLRGEAGIGKTRLSGRFTDIARDHGFAVHRALVLDFGVGKGQDAVRTLVRSLLSIPAGSAKEERRQAAERALSQGMIDREQHVFLNDLLDLPQPTALKALYDAMDNDVRNTGKQTLVARLVESAGRARPLLILIEDVHWAEGVTLAHLAALCVAVAECPAILLMTSRIEGDPLDRSWRAAIRGSPLVTVDLSPLRRSESEEVAQHLVGASSPFLEDCIARAEGNPLFLEQLLRNVDEDARSEVPDSIQSLVLARMDRLSPPDKLALQAASVIGQRFGLDAVRHLLGKPDYDCGELIDHHLVIPEGDGFLFAHALIREGVYGSLLESRQQDLHREAAAWFAGRDLALRAQHLDRAGDEAAAFAYREAAEAQASVYHFDRATVLVERGLEIASDDADRSALSLLLGQLLLDSGHVPEARAAYETALKATPDDAQRCRAQIGIAACMRITDDEFAPALATLDDAESIAHREGLMEELARIHHLRGNLYFPMGRIDDCLAEHQKALIAAREADSPELEARALGGLGDAAYMQGRLRTLLDFANRCCEICEREGFGQIEVANRPMLGVARMFLNEIERAAEELKDNAEVARRIGQPRAELVTRLAAAMPLLELRRYDEVLVHVTRADAIVEMLGTRRFYPENHWTRAQILLDQDRRAEAESLLEEAMQICRETGIHYMGGCVAGLYAMVIENPQHREEILEEGEAVVRSGSPVHNATGFYRHAAEDCLRRGEWARAEDYAAKLEAYMAAEPVPWSEFICARARALAAYGRGMRDPETMAALKSLSDQALRDGLLDARQALEKALSEGG